MLGAGGLTLALALVAPAPWTPASGLGAVVLAGAAYVLERRGIVLRWRGQRILSTFSEAFVLAGLVLLPPLAVPFAAGASRLVQSIACRRPAVKILFNVAQLTFAGALAALVMLALVAGGLPLLLAATAGAASYSVATESTISLLFARLEGASAWRVYRERLALGHAYSLSMGLGLGLCALALWRVHPVALVALVPVVLALTRYARLQTLADREGALHERLASEQAALIGCRDHATIARHVLAAATDVLDAGRVRLVIGDASWTHEAHAPRGETAPSLAQPVIGREGVVLGRLDAWERPGKPAFERGEGELLRIVAGQAANAVESARALNEVAAQRDLLARTDRMSTLGTLVAGVAHEVNNPLTYVGGNIELALGDLRDLQRHFEASPVKPPVDLAETTRALETATRGATHIAHIVQSLRTVARQRQVGAREPVSLNEVVANVATLLGVALPPSLTLEVQRAPDDPRVVASSPDLHQAVLNLAKNAIEALGDRPGTVRLCVRAVGPRLHLDVEDDGPGIAPETLRRIRDPFFTTKKEGTGLGISIVEGIAEDHGGALRIESAPGRGARFTLDLPLWRPQSFSPGPGLAAPEGSL